MNRLLAAVLAPESTNELLVFAGVAVVTGLTSPFVARALLTWAVPPCEVVGPSGRSRGDRRLGWLGAFFVFVLGSLIVPVVLEFTVFK